ncbi:hypothetical protein BDN72DRAFT_762922, partial [Pluteus cervinus]
MAPKASKKAPAGPSLQKDVGSQPTDKFSRTREGIQARIHGLEEQILELRRSLNAATPVGVLPPEILTQIFELGQLSRTGSVKRHRLLKFSWVSHHWRRVALESPSLWATIDNSNDKWALQCLQRSQGTPL